MLVLVGPFEQVGSNVLRAISTVLMGLKLSSIKHSEIVEELIARFLVIIIFNLLR